MLLKQFSRISIFAIFIFIPQCLFSANYYWVGNTGDCDELSHWSNSSGGAGGAYVSLPTATDNVIFDLNSFTLPGQIVNVNIDLTCADLNFSGVLNNPEFAGSGSYTIEVYGDLTFDTGLVHTFFGDYHFLSNASSTISSAGKTFNGDILFNRSLGQWNLSDEMIVSGEIGLRSGEFNTMDQNLIAGNINANLGTQLRTIDFGSSIVTLIEEGLALDLRGNTTNLTVLNTSAVLNFTNTDDIVVEVGAIAKTIPTMRFINCSGSIEIITGSVEDNTNRITFGDIEVLIDGVEFIIDSNNDDSNIKTYGSVTLPNNCRYIIGSGDGTGGYGGTDHTIFNDDFIVGNGGQGDMHGRYVEFLSDFIIGEDSDCRFSRDVQFQGDFSVNGTDLAHIILDQDAEFAGNLNFSGTNIVRIDGETNIVGDLNIADDCNLTLQNNGGAATTSILGSINLGAESIIDIGGGEIGDFTIDAIDLLNEAQLNINTNTSITTINELTLSSFNIVRFNTSAVTNITGTLSSVGLCDIWLWLRSLNDGETADVNFSSLQTVTSNICQDINVTSLNMTNTAGVDLSNNSGVLFTTPVLGLTFYWVGNTIGNAKTGLYSTGINNDWSNPDNWTLISGLYTGANTCIPGPHDDVVFDASSFNAGGGTVDIDLVVQGCNNMLWTGIPAGISLDGSLTETNRELIVFGDLELHGNLDNQFEALITFSAHDVGTRTITNNGAQFFGRIDFEFSGGTWSILDNMDMNGGTRADVNFISGTVLANAIDWSIEDDWYVYDGVFDAGTSTIIFDGPDTQTSRQEILSNGSPFYNLSINRETNGGGNANFCELEDPLTVDSDLNIQRGGLADRGFQITGNAFGNLTIEDAARIVLGESGLLTTFPTDFLSVNIDLNERGRTYYNSDLTQIVSSVPTYGALYLQNHDGSLVDKILDGPITINDILSIGNYNNFMDDGFQITGDAGEELQMDPNAQLTIGNTVTATDFPTNFSVFDLREPSTVVYNAQDDQEIKGMIGAGNSSYWHLTVNYPAMFGSSEKTLVGDIKIRGDFSIHDNNIVDIDDPNDYSIELLGDWLNEGTFVQHEGLVSLTGTAEQIIRVDGANETFHDLTINNTSAAGIVIEDDITIDNDLVLTDGIIYEGSLGNEVVHISTGANVTGASNASHVNGRVERTGTTAFDFPVGKNGLYRPISIGASSSGTVGFIAEYNQSDPGFLFDPLLLILGIDHISRCEYWNLNRSTVALGTVSVKLSWNSSTSCGIVNMADLRVSRWNLSLWNNEGNGGTTGSPIIGDILSAGSVSNYGTFTLGSISDVNPLPIELLKFYAELNENVVDLDWVTASELNNDFFTVQRSKDGINFEDIELVEGAGNSSKSHDYESCDRAPVFGLSYYRLRQTDFDGMSTYSEIRTINYEPSTMMIYPNPVKNGTNAHLVIEHEMGAGLIEIYDVNGHFILKTDGVEGDNLLDLTNLHKGSYFVRFTNEKYTKTKKLILQ